MFEHFTDQTRRVVVLSQIEAKDRRDDYIGSEHLLLALATVEPRRSATNAASVLNGLGVTRDTVLAKLKELDEAEQNTVPRVVKERLPFSPTARVILDRAPREAAGLGEHSIKPDFVLLALARQELGVALQVLALLDVDLLDLRRKVIEPIAIAKAS